MITKEQLRNSIRHEIGVIKHLATKIPDGTYDWRPTPGQRSTRELMQYLTFAALSPTLYNLTGNWEHDAGVHAEAETFQPEDFAAAMDRQLARIEEALADVDEQRAATEPRQMPWGAPTLQGAALMDMPLKVLVAYRMQLFLYAKMSGNADIGPANCWAGMDMPQAS